MFRLHGFICRNLNISPNKTIRFRPRITVKSIDIDRSVSSNMERSSEAVNKEASSVAQILLRARTFGSSAGKEGELSNY